MRWLCFSWVAMLEFAVKMIEIQNIGKVLHVDHDGFLVNESKPGNIRPPWLGAVEDIKLAYIDHLGDRLHSIYVRGSVSRGTAIEGLSDIDCIILVRGKITDLALGWKDSLIHELKIRYPFSTHFDLEEVPYEEVLNGERPTTAFNIKVNAVCVAGEDIATQLKPFKPGKDCVTVASWFNTEHLDKKIQFIDGGETLDWQEESMWLAKHILRLGFELVMQRDQSYTRDLYPCYQIFSQYYPEKEPAMRHVLEIAINHSDARAEILEMLNGTGRWVVNAAKEAGLNNRRV